MRFMFACRFPIVSLLILLPALAFAAAPTFVSKEKVMLLVNEYKAECEHVFAGKKIKNEYSIDLAAVVRVPSKLDIVCISDEMTIVSAIDTKRKSVHVPPKFTGASLGKGVKENFNAIILGSAETELNGASLKANPYVIKEMTVQTNAVIASKRKEVLLAADVEQSLKDVGHGIRLRVSSMKIDSRRNANITIECKRPAGSTGTFVEAIYILDDKGKELGGGRWGKAEGIFSSNTQFKGTFKLAAGPSIAQIKCVLVTAYEVRPLEFVLTDIFQK